MAVLAAGRVVLAGGAPGAGPGPGWIAWEGGRLTGAGAGRPPRRPDLDLPAATVVPGFVDLHCHGGGGADLPTTDPAEVRRAVELHRSRGTTTQLASLVTAAPEVLLEQVRVLAACAEEGLVAGVHLEGPWLSERYCGAHPPALLRDPDPAEVDALLDAARGHLRMVTLAPERRGALAAVRRLAAAGVLVAVGHTGADHDAVRAAVDAGARVATHLFNAMPPLRGREPGPVGALLADERVVVELIADGVHVHPVSMRAVMAAAGPERTALVTDAMAAAGAPDGDYRLGALDVAVRGGVARLPGSGALAGSTLTMDAALRCAVHEVGAPLGAAVAAVSTAPARLLGLEAGALEAGRWADAVVLDAGLGVLGVLRRGSWVREPAAS